MLMQKKKVIGDLLDLIICSVFGNTAESRDGVFQYASKHGNPCTLALFQRWAVRQHGSGSVEALLERTFTELGQWSCQNCQVEDPRG